MITVIQRVSRAQVSVNHQVVARVGRGMLALVGIESGDTPEVGRQLVERVLGYRIFSDEAGKMNLDLRQIGGELLLIPQFTLVAETNKGARPSFSKGASPQEARILYAAMVTAAETLFPRVARGVFGVDMQVELVNDGPVTFWLKA